MTYGEHVLVTGGAGYTGSLLVAELLREGYLVTVLDSLLYGGDALIPFLKFPGFHFVKSDVTEAGAVRLAQRRDWPRPSAILHLAALDGFPVCQAVGRDVAARFNMSATQRVFDQAEQLGIARFIFASSYSVYANDPDCNPVTEDSPLEPHSIFAETKILAETWLRENSANASSAVLIFRPANTYGLSPRMRFDLLINQFVLEAFLRHELVIYQQAYSRSFIHVQDAVRGYMMALEAPEGKVRSQVYNLGGERGNYTKDGIANLVLQRFPEVVVRYKDLTFGGEQRDLVISYDKIQRELGFEALKTVDEGVEEVSGALRSRLIHNPHERRFHNAETVVQ